MDVYHSETREAVKILSRQRLTLPARFTLINFLSTLVPIHSLVQYNLTELVQLHTINIIVPDNLGSRNGN